MAKRHRHRLPIPTPSPPPPPSPKKIAHIENQMRGLIEAARAPRARRFVTPTQVQSRINAIIQAEAFPNERTRELHKAPSSERASVTVPANSVHQRNALHKSPVLRARLPKPMRNVLLDSERALECARRETRREVMFAMRRTGKGGRKNRKARWTVNSRISCKGR